MSGRRRQTLSPSLFPFLAVLVCTLGTLILLLALVAQNATETAEQTARAQQEAAQEEAAKLAAQQEADDEASPQMTAESVAQLIEEETFRATELVSFRDKQTGKVEERRDQLTHLEDHITRLREELRLLEEEIEHANDDSAHTNVIDINAVEDIKDKIKAEELAISRLKDSAKNKTPRIVIVPHDGPNGTSRRPIYLECTRDGVTIWPEGNQISQLQMSDSFADANPLDAALRAIRYHALQTYGDNVPPYPLLVVRPDGIESYSAARIAMQDWDDQFGYELVPAEVKLAFPNPDPNLKKRIDVVVRQAAAKQHARHAVARRQSGSYGRSGKFPVLSASELRRQGRAGGYQPHREQFPSGYGQSPYQPKPPIASENSYSSGARGNSPSYGSGSQYTQGHDNGQAQAEAVRRLDQHLRDAAKELRENNHKTALSQIAPGAMSQEELANLMAGTAASMANNSAGGLEKTNGGQANATLQSTPSADVVQHNPYGPPSDGPSGDTAPTLDAPANANNEGSVHDSAEKEGGQFATGQGQVSGGSDEFAPSTNSQPMAANAQGGQAGGAQSSGSPSTEMAAQGTDPSVMEQQDQAPSINVTHSDDLVKRQGRNWALPKSLAGVYGNKIVRSIRVLCYEDRFVLLPARSDGATEMFGFSDGHVNRATLELATAIRDRIAQWGAALPGGRWQPLLEVEVMPRGEARFHQLRTLMNGSGVEIRERKTR